MPPNKYGTDGPTVEMIFKTYKSSSRTGTLFLDRLKFHSLPPFPERVIVLDISRNPELITLPVLPKGLRTLNCRDNPNLTTITGPCPEGIKDDPADYVFKNCPKLKVQPNPDEPCGEFFRRFVIAEATGKKATDQAIRDVYEENTGQSAQPGTGPADFIREYAGLQPPKGSGRKTTRKSKKRRSTRKSKLTRSR